MAIRVLIVDDSGLTRLLLRHIIKTDDNLELIGVAIDGDQARKLLQVLDADLVLLDLEMPHMDGFQFLEESREKFAGKIIVFSVRAQETKERILKLGADAVVQKPRGDINNLVGTPEARHLVETIYEVMEIQAPQ